MDDSGGEGDGARTLVLGNVLPENRTFFEDVFMDNDSEDDFLGFEDDLDDNGASGGDCDHPQPGIDRWRDGNLHPTLHAFTGKSCVELWHLH